MNFKGQYFQFIDVIGDGACFYYSVLKEKEILEKFKDVESIRCFMYEYVSNNYGNDANLKKIFAFYNTCVEQWFSKIERRYEWATSVDVVLFSYLTNYNVITITNYESGFYFINNGTELNYILRENVDFSKNPTIHILFHNCGRALMKINGQFVGNHFAYLKKIMEIPIQLAENTIEKYCGIVEERFTNEDEENEFCREVFKCYCLVKMKMFIYKSKTMYDIWKMRNSTLAVTISENELNKKYNYHIKKRKILSKKIKESIYKNIIEENKKEYIEAYKCYCITELKEGGKNKKSI